MLTKWESGTIYGRLMTTGKTYNNERSRRYVEVICKCGTIKWVRLDGIVTGENVSCGCYNIERVKSNPPHLTHGLTKHPLWRVYRSIKDRCYYPSSNRFKNYGAKGVVMCDEWINDYPSFYNWAIDKWKPGLQIDKDILYKEKYGTSTGMIYSPEFCCFITPKQNNRNRTTSRNIEFNGQTKTMAEWAEEIGLSQSTLSARINKQQWSIERALTKSLKIFKPRLL